MKSPSFYIKWLVVLAVLWLLRPLFHGLVMTFIASPLTIVLLALIIWGVYRGIKNRGGVKFVKVSESEFRMESSTAAKRGIALYSIALVLVLIGLVVQSEVRANITAKQQQFEERTSGLPTVNPVRLMPKSVATRYAEDSFQNPQESLGDSQIVFSEGKLQRVFPRLPDGGILYFLNKLNGFVTVDVDTLDRKVAIEDSKFEYSEGIGVFDNINFRLPLKRYFVTYSKEPIYLKNDADTWVTVVPYITYKGFPFTVPTWGGVMIVQEDGSMQDYSPEEAQKLSYLQGNRIHPKELAEYYTHSYAYNGGLINKWFLHKNQTEIVALPGDEQVIHTATTEGFKQLVVAEPYGASYGIYKIFMIDATTGKREVISFDSKSQLTGPVAAADYIKKEFPTFDWTAFTLAEPRPLVVNSKLYWLLSIIPNDSAGIANTVVLDTQTNKVTTMTSQDQLAAFLAGQEVAPAVTPTSTSNSNAAIDKINQIQKQLDELKAELNK